MALNVSESVKWYWRCSAGMGLGIAAFIAGGLARIIQGVNEVQLHMPAHPWIGFLFLTMVCGGLCLLVGCIFSLKKLEKLGEPGFRWEKLTGQYVKYFPETSDERAFLMPWARKVLYRQVEIALCCFSSRDAVSKRYQSASLASEKKRTPDAPALNGNVEVPSSLLQYREKRRAEDRNLRELYEDTKTASANADAQWKKFMAQWDLFKELGMIPVDPKTERPFDNPSSFKNMVEAEQKEQERVGTVLAGG